MARAAQEIVAKQEAGKKVLKKGRGESELSASSMVSSSPGGATSSISSGSALGARATKQLDNSLSANRPGRFHSHATNVALRVLPTGTRFSHGMMTPLDFFVFQSDLCA